MKVEIFSDYNMDVLMRRINKWFEANPKAVLRQSSQSSAAQASEEGAHTIVVTISIFFTE